MSDLGWNIWGVVGGVVIAMVPLFSVWLRARLPSTRLPALLSLLQETKELFAAALRERLITDEGEIRQLDFSIAT